MKVLVVGSPGSGKSSVLRALSELKEAYDLESWEFNLFSHPKGSTAWICDIALLQKFLEEQKEYIAFYGCNGSNMEEVLPLFDVVVLLRVSPTELAKRLESREGNLHSYGKTKEERDAILAGHLHFEERMGEYVTFCVDANVDTKEVANAIIQLTNPD
tara:strand:- start:372 stop:845 length:474 start_codon:yes stop_codon:yes gene_type:complete